MIIDTHAHYDDEQFDEDRSSLLKELHQSGIERIVNIGCSLESGKRTIALTREFDFVYGALGFHPDSIKNVTEEQFSWLKEHVLEDKIVAVGEIGLDYYWDKEHCELQKEWFARQMDLARQVSKPIVVHSRDAAKDTLDVMKAEQAQTIGGVIHCFSYGIEMAREYLNMGYYLGIGGVVTFKNAKKLVEVVEYAPLDRIVLETDCPYLSPEPNRGKRNQSGNLEYVAQKIAEIKNKTYEEVVAITNVNAKQLYRMKQ